MDYFDWQNKEIVTDYKNKIEEAGLDEIE